jgi:hypothetical protein
MPPSPPSTSRASEGEITRRTVTTIVGVVVGLMFMFGFGNVWSLALRLGVPAVVAPLVAPAVDLSVVGLLLGCRHLAIRNGTPDVRRRARWLLLFSSIATLALNVSGPLSAGHAGAAAFDAVGPVLLIGWSEVGPGLLHAINTADDRPARTAPVEASSGSLAPRMVCRPSERTTGRSDLLQQARQEDAHHRATYQRPISAEALRKRHASVRTSHGTWWPPSGMSTQRIPVPGRIVPASNRDRAA